ncbi:PTS system mannose/fructose/N-acetylgalactosamine-transporter subunit IIB [Enterococcus faecalis]
MINFIRIDDRLIHGQVVTAWIKEYKTNRIWVIDDIAAEDEFLKNVMKMVAPSSVQLEITGTQGLAEKIHQYDESKENIMILVKTPKVAQKIFDAGVQLRLLNVGGMGANDQRRSLYKNISISEEEEEVLKDLVENGIDVYVQVIPNDKKTDFIELLSQN